MLRRWQDCLGATVRKVAWNSNRLPRFPKANLNVYRSAGVVPGLSQLWTAPCEPAPAIAGSRGGQWHGLGEGVAAVYTGDGGRIDGPYVDAARRAAVSGATVAPAAGGLRNGAAV